LVFFGGLFIPIKEIKPQTNVYITVDLKQQAIEQRINLSELMKNALLSVLNSETSGGIQEKEKVAEKEKDAQYNDFLLKTDSWILTNSSALKVWALKTGRSVDFLISEKSKLVNAERAAEKKKQKQAIAIKKKKQKGK